MINILDTINNTNTNSNTLNNDYIKLHKYSFEGKTSKLKELLKQSKFKKEKKNLKIPSTMSNNLFIFLYLNNKRKS